MSDNQRIQHIDAWRFIAVSLVIQGHLLVHSNFSVLVTSIRSCAGWAILELGVFDFFLYQRLRYLQRVDGGACGHNGLA
jgi:peptidoglycan/LPS O-acetylase OafA/YrhL